MGRYRIRSGDDGHRKSVTEVSQVVGVDTGDDRERTVSTRLLVACVVIIGCMLSCCRPDPVPIELEFPSTETFLYSELGQLTVFSITRGELGECPAIVEESMAGSLTRSPIIDTGERSICGFCNGGASYDDVAEGPRAFVMVVRDAANTPLLTGCTTGEIYEEAPPIVINLFITPEYEGVAAAGPPPFSDPIRKCGGECQ